jgi:hypothetical protein
VPLHPLLPLLVVQHPLPLLVQALPLLVVQHPLSLLLAPLQHPLLPVRACCRRACSTD